jgi:hypothetical protein
VDVGEFGDRYFLVYDYDLVFDTDADNVLSGFSVTGEARMAGVWGLGPRAVHNMSTRLLP